MLNLAQLGVLLARIKHSNLSLQSERKLKQVAVICFQLANNHMLVKYSASLVAAKQRFELLLSRWTQKTPVVLVKLGQIQIEGSIIWCLTNLNCSYLLFNFQSGRPLCHKLIGNVFAGE